MQPSILCYRYCRSLFSRNPRYLKLSRGVGYISEDAPLPNQLNLFNF